jgi:hypothetical protein
MEGSPETDIKPQLRLQESYAPLQNRWTKKMAQLSELRDAGGKEYKASIFGAQAQAALAKAIIFAAEASVANKSGQLIWASIASYYALFHLTISLMFMVPKLIEQQELVKLVNARQQGASDPTYLVKYRDLGDFLRNAESRGLTDQLRKQLNKSKKLREFVNYQPRIEWKDGIIVFRTKAYKIADLQEVLESVESLLAESLRWAKQQDETSELVAFVSAIAVKWFLTQDDLLYKDWCSPRILGEAELIRRNLPIQVESW